MPTVIALALILSSALAPTPPVGHTVTIRGKAFAPNTITINAGEELVFTSDDGVAHRLFSASPTIAFSFKEILPGGAASVGFATAGSGEVRCANHPNMKLLVTVR